MIGIKITAKERGKTPTKLVHDLQIELQRSRNSCLEAIRQQLLKESPKRSKGNKWSEDKIYKFLSSPTNCIRKRGRFGGYVILDENKLKHLKYVVNDCKLGSWIYPKGKALKICYPKQPKGAICGFLYARVRGHSANNFIEKAYIRSKRWVRYYSKKHIESAIMKK